MTTGAEVWKEKKHKRKWGPQGTVIKLGANGGCKQATLSLCGHTNW